MAARRQPQQQACQVLANRRTSRIGSRPCPVCIKCIDAARVSICIRAFDLLAQVRSKFERMLARNLRDALKYLIGIERSLVSAIVAKIRITRKVDAREHILRAASLQTGRQP